MEFPSSLISGRLIKRYKRFLADVTLESGEVVTAHCPNSGSMKTCVAPDWDVRMSYSDNPKRKLAYTLELVHNGDCWICVNTHRANAVVAEAIEAQQIPELTGYEGLKREVPVEGRSRLDIVLNDPEKGECFIEIKTVTLLDSDSYAFPDAVTTRGLKHLHALMQAKKAGKRAVLFFLVMRSDSQRFRPAAQIDPAYADGLKEAVESGVEVLVYQAKISPEALNVQHRITEVHL